MKEDLLSRLKNIFFVKLHIYRLIKVKYSVSCIKVLNKIKIHSEQMKKEQKIYKNKTSNQNNIYNL